MAVTVERFTKAGRADEQTALYDADDASVLRELIAQAQAVANSSGEMVEVYTADGIVAASVTPDR